MKQVFFCSLIKNENNSSCSTEGYSESSSTMSGNEEGAWVVSIDSMDNYDIDNYPDNLSWEKELQKTNIIGCNSHRNYYNLIGCPSSFRQEEAMNWLITSFQSVGYFVETIAGESKFSITMIINSSN